MGGKGKGLRTNMMPHGKRWTKCCPGGTESGVTDVDGRERAVSIPGLGQPRGAAIVIQDGTRTGQLEWPSLVPHSSSEVSL